MMQVPNYVLLWQTINFGKIGACCVGLKYGCDCFSWGIESVASIVEVNEAGIKVILQL